MVGEGQRQTYLEMTYKTVLTPRTVLVETTDCNDYGWNVRLNKNCCVLRKDLIFVIAKAFVSSSYRTARRYKVLRNVARKCTLWLSENWSKHSLISYESGVFVLRIEVWERFIGVIIVI